jgi:hypothetical protein
MAVAAVARIAGRPSRLRAGFAGLLLAIAALGPAGILALVAAASIAGTASIISVAS